MKTNLRSSLLSVLTILLITACGLGGMFTSPITPTRGVIARASPLPTTSPTPLPPVYATIYVNQYETFSVYRDADLWRNAIGYATVSVEDFERDGSDPGELPDPFLTRNGLLLRCTKCPAQILSDVGIIGSGHMLHFRDFADGLSFTFPQAQQVLAFAFEYRAAEDWMLRINQTVVPLQGGRAAYVGVAFQNTYPSQFTLSSNAHAQGGFSIDNLAYVPR